MAESAPEIVAEEDPRSEEQKNLAKLHEAVIQRLTQVPERIAAIQASFFDLKGLSNLMDLTKEMQLDPTPCPDPAKELHYLHTLAKEKKEECAAAEEAALAAVDEAVTRAEDPSLFSEMQRSSAEAVQLSARSQCLDQIQKASEHLQRYWEETQEENEETQQKQLLERVHNRFNVVKQALPQCLEHSHWPMALETIYKQKQQAKLIKDFWEDGGKMVEGGHKAMELLEAYIRALDEKQRECQEHVGSSKERVNRFHELVWKAISDLDAAMKDYLEETILNECLSTIESNLADAKIAAKIMQEDALKEYGESHEASTQLISQAEECHRKVTANVKESARRLLGIARGPAELSVQSTEMCRQFAEKLREEKEAQLLLTCKELDEANRKKTALEGKCKGLASSKQGDLVRIKNKVKVLEESKEATARELEEAKGLCKKAMDQLNELLELEGANYSFDMKKIKDAAEADVSKSWMESAYPHPDEDDDDVSTEAPSVAEPGGVISKRGKDPYEEIQKLQKELAKLEAYRKVDQAKILQLENENKDMIDELRKEMQTLRHDDHCSVGSGSSYHLVEEAEVP